jgi:hypothetical protein
MRKYLDAFFCLYKKGQMETQKAEKNSTEFLCEKCSFVCKRKCDYNRHIATPKHLKETKGDEKAEKNGGDFKCECGKSYLFRQGLWRHKKKCLPSTQTDVSNNDVLILELFKQNQEFQKQLLELVKDSGSHNVTNSHNKTTNRFNMNFFLNEKCKDAMNITDFVSSIKLTLQDLEKTAELGYVKGMTNIIVNGLNQLDLHKRPIHCSDVKRETLYVKDNNIWEKEKEDKQKITKAIKHISVRNAKQVGAWTKENEGYNISTNKKNDKYLKIVSEANGGEPEEINKIIANVSTHVTIPPL